LAWDILNYPFAMGYGNITICGNNPNRHTSFFIWIIASLHILQ
jgi:hypothetical protein